MSSHGPSKVLKRIRDDPDPFIGQPNDAEHNLILMLIASMYSPAHSEWLNQDAFITNLPFNTLKMSRDAGCFSKHQCDQRVSFRVCVISRRKCTNTRVHACVCVFIQECLWSCERPSVCVWSVYAFRCVYACTRLVISDKGHREWQRGQPAGVCQCSDRFKSGLSDRDFSLHTGHSCY